MAEIYELLYVNELLWDERCARCGADVVAWGWRRCGAIAPRTWLCEECGWHARRGEAGTEFVNGPDAVPLLGQW